MQGTINEDPPKVSNDVGGGGSRDNRNDHLQMFEKEPSPFWLLRENWPTKLDRDSIVANRSSADGIKSVSVRCFLALVQTSPGRFAFAVSIGGGGQFC